MATASTCPSPTTHLASGYWDQSRQPLQSLVFVLPLLAAYEAGVVIFGPQAVRNGADVWLRQLLEVIGFGQYFLLPTLTICILVAWHHTTQQPWRVNTSVFWGMGAESILLAFGLRLILELQGTLMAAACAPAEPWATAAVSLSLAGEMRSVAGYLGAGVYEELLFRLILLSLLVWTARRLGAAATPAVVVGVLVTSLTFAAAHYVGTYGEPVELTCYAFWFSFLFRFLAGVFFGVLFVCRGFGIAAGAHAGYDILVGIF